jgi:gamma-D-glutamyl-L-lysine dipeptidyl-peptidase
MTGRININVADVRREASNRSERVSQGLFNEIIEVIDDSEQMQRVRFQDSYEGWVLKQFISEHDGFYGHGPYLIDSGLAPAFEKPELTSKRLTLLPYGSKLYGTVEDGFLRIRSDRYGVMYISGYNIMGGDEIQPLTGEDSFELQKEAEKFLGAPYLWGGRTMFGIDCSGYVGALAARFGVILPRDSKQQFEVGEKIAKEDIIRGDLLFFPGHVAMAISNSLYIHSSRYNGGVAYNSLNMRDAVYNENLDRSLILARRIFI